MIKICVPVILALLLCDPIKTLAAQQVNTANVEGYIEAPRRVHGDVDKWMLVGDTTFGWQTGELSGDIVLNGHSLVINTGGGNRTVLNGAITGEGSVEWSGGIVPQPDVSILRGAAPNAFNGDFTLTRGVLDLDKPENIYALGGNFVVGRDGPAMVRWRNSNQIPDDSLVTLGKPGVNTLNLMGWNERFGSLDLQSHSEIDLAEKSKLLIGDSSDVNWNLQSTLTIWNHVPGQSILKFGVNAEGLTPAQAARIAFMNPKGSEEGLHTAVIQSDGSIEPGEIVVAIAPPFDVSREKRAQRAQIYEIDGLAALTSSDTPLRQGITISFFGDSLTWLNSYIRVIEAALQDGEGTADLEIRLINRGINGGGVLSVRDGSENAAYPGKSFQAPFADVIKADESDLAVILIGINDIWWRDTSPQDFEQGLQDIVDASMAQGTKPVLATMTVRGEMPDGSNPDDPKIDAYCDITRRVATNNNLTLVDLRRAYVAALQNLNAQLRVDGTLYMRTRGVLTHDGVHPTPRGNELLANLISDGIYRALSDSMTRTGN